MPRVLFVKTSSLGDVVHQCPAVSDAARHVPGIEIDWVVEEGFAPIARMHRAVRAVLPVALRRWRRALWRGAAWREMAAARSALASERYDAVIDTQGLLKSAVLARLAHGTRHGMDRSSAREPLAARLYQVVHQVPRGLHAVERNRRLTGAALGYRLDGSPDYGLRSRAQPPQSLPGVYAVLLTMTSRADKLWPETRWIELGKALALPVVLPWGGMEERSRAERIARGIGQAVVPQAMGLEALATLFAGARGVIGLDSGLTHLAAALGVPTTAIFCATDPHLTGVYAGPHAVNVGARGAPPRVDEVLRHFA